MNLKSNKAITLVALIITIIILLILAGVSLSMVLGDNGLINKAQSSVDKYQQSANNEQLMLDSIEEYIESKLKKDGELTLSETSGNCIYPNTLSFTVTNNKSGGTLSVTSSDTNVATVNINDNTITITPKNVNGTATITVKSAKTEEYNESAATYIVTVKRVITVTPAEIAASPTTYYGAKVVNYTKGATYRIFYVDTENKYKDGNNTVYLIADIDRNAYIATENSSGSYTAYGYDENKTKIREMNPEWAENRGSSVWGENEKAVAYLCDTSKWNDYYDEEKANYVIGSPSLEMYADSYNNTHSVNSLIYTYTPTTGTSTTNNGHGYFVGANGVFSHNGQRTETDVIDNTSQNGIYMLRIGHWYWLASPASMNYYDVFCLYSPGGLGSSQDLKYDRGICPIVSLKSTTPIKIEM